MPGDIFIQPIPINCNVDYIDFVICVFHLIRTKHTNVKRVLLFVHRVSNIEKWQSAVAMQRSCRLFAFERYLFIFKGTKF